MKSSIIRSSSQMLCLFILFIIAIQIKAETPETVAPCSLSGCMIPDAQCTYCNKCNPGKYTLFELDKNQLDKSTCYEKVEGCDKYNVEGRCYHCINDLSVVEINGTQHCSPCSSLTLDKKCNSCDSEKSFFLKVGLCLEIPHCQSITDGICSKCKPDAKLFSLDDGTSKCYSKIVLCENQIFNHCEKCDQTSLINPNTKGCSLKIKNCSLHSFKENHAICELCDEGFELDIFGKCHYSACLKSTHGICDACAEGYFLDDKRKCEKRITNCIIQEEKVCHKCNKGFIFTDFSCKPSNCKELAEVDANNSASSDTKAAHRKEIINTLNKYFRLKVNENTKAEPEIHHDKDHSSEFMSPCLKCNLGYYLDNVTGLCWSPEASNTDLVYPNCLEVFDGICHKCKEGFEKSPEGLCVPQHCMIINSNHNECKICLPGFYLDEKKECAKCESKESNLEFCSFCGNSMMIRSHYIKGLPLCVSIIEECKTYLKSHIDLCETCNYGFDVSQDGKVCFEKNKMNPTTQTCKKMIGNLEITYKLIQGVCHPPIQN